MLMRRGSVCRRLLLMIWLIAAGVKSVARGRRSVLCWSIRSVRMDSYTMRACWGGVVVGRSRAMVWVCRHSRVSPS